MSKRFTDTEKWRDPWFRKLPLSYKTVWFYLVDNCDAAGVWKIDLELMEFTLGESIDWSDFISKMDGRVVVTHDQKAVIIPSFIPFQYGQLSEECRAHFPIFKILKAHEQKGYSIGYSKGMNTLQEKEKEKERKEEGCGEKKTTAPLRTDEWVRKVVDKTTGGKGSDELTEALKAWVSGVRRLKKCSHNERSASLLAKKLKSLELAEAVAQVDRSANAGWSDIYPETRVTPEEQPELELRNAEPAGWRNALRDLGYENAKGDEQLEARYVAEAEKEWHQVPGYLRDEVTNYLKTQTAAR